MVRLAAKQTSRCAYATWISTIVLGLGLAGCSGSDSPDDISAPPVHELPEAQGCDDLANTAATIEKTYTSASLDGSASGGALESGIYELVSDTKVNPAKVGTTTRIQLTMAIDSARGLLYTVQTDDSGTHRYNSTLQRSGNSMTLRHTCPNDSNLVIDGYTVDGSSLSIFVDPQARELVYARR